MDAQKPSSTVAVDVIELQSDQSQANCMATHYSSHSPQCSSMQGCFSGHLQCTGIPVNQMTSLTAKATEPALIEATYSSPFPSTSMRPPIV